MSTPGPVALRPLAVLTLVVAAAHLLVLQEASLSLSPGDMPPPRATALTTRTLAPAPPEPVAAPAPAAPAPIRPKKAQPAPPRPAEPISLAPKVIEPGPPENTVNGTGPAPDSLPDSTATASVTPPPAPAAAAAATEPAPTASAGQPVDGATLSAAVPPSVRLLYNLNGLSRKLEYHARGEVLWRQGGQRYELRASISAFLIGSRAQTSEGDITPQGLAPRRHADSWRGEKAAHFNRETQRISFSVNTPDAPLLPGAQDRLSLFMQLGALMAADPQRLAPGTSVRLQTVSTREASVWVITSEGEERLNLPGGDVSAFKFTRVPRKEFDTRLDLWIAPSMNYLPVRIRVTQSNGDFVDQQLRATEPVEDLK